MTDEKMDAISDYLAKEKAGTIPKTPESELPNLNSGRMAGKSYHTFMSFIQAVRSGKRAIVIGKGYVVISQEEYNKLLKHQPPVFLTKDEK